MTLHIVPIEPIEKRYSAQWILWFDKEIRKISSNYLLKEYDPLRYMDGGTPSTIKCGEFLDVLDTNLYKALQIKALVEMVKANHIKDGDTILLLDGWFPGVEALAYIRDALGLKIKLVAMLHAGTYDPHDFLSQKGMGKWGKYVEAGWFNIYDKIIVATQFHKQLLIKTREVEANKIHVIFFPMYTDWVKYLEIKQELIVFPHRLAPEKNPQKFDELLNYSYPTELNFMTTADNFTTKEDYWDTLARARFAVSFADQETFGIAMIESVLSGAIPIVPDRLSYSELYPDIFKYKSSHNPPVEVEQVHKFICRYYNDSHFRNLIEMSLVFLREKFTALGATSIPTIMHTCLVGE